MAFKLRPYQQRAVNDCLDFIYNKNVKSGIVVAPTGAGKSLIVANLAKELKQPVLCLQPSKELLEQNYAKYTSYGLEASVFSASLGKKEIGDVIFATPKSVANSIKLFSHIKYIIIDECHLGTKKGGIIHSTVEALKPKKVIGLTATPIYLQTIMEGSILKMMNRSQSSFMRNIIHVTQIKELTDNGYWSDLLYENRYVDTSMLKMNSSGAEFSTESMERMYINNNTRENLLTEIQQLKKEGRKSILVFVPSVEEANSLARIVPDSESASAETKKKERERIVSEFKAGKVKVLFNCNLFAVGFDHPELDAIITTRPTASLAVYYQQVGRGCRIADGKKNCKIVDLAGNSYRFGKVEELNFDDIDGHGWGMFAGDRLISSIIMSDGFDITKTDIRNKLRESLTTTNPILVKGKIRFTFGKYKGMKIADVYTKDANYLYWMASDKFETYTHTAKKLKKDISEYLKNVNLVNHVKKNQN